MKLFKHGLAMVATGALVVGCSGTDEATAAEDSAAAGAPDTNEVSETAAEPAAADWSRLNDSAVRAAIDARLEEFYQSNGQRFGLLVVDSLGGGDRFQAAGEAAFSLGMPAIVVSTNDKNIQFVGDEALAYMADERARMATETAEYFNRGEFEQGVDHALDEIEHAWQGG